MVRSKNATEFSDELGQVIRKLRKQQRLSQVALADATQLSKRTVQVLEQGGANPGLHMLTLLSKALDTPLSVIFDQVELRYQ